MASATPIRRRRRILRRAAIGAATLAISAFAALAGGELYLRWTGAYHFGPPVGYLGMFEEDGEGSVRLVRGFRSELTVEGRRVAIQINDLGMRGPAPDLAAAGRRRLLVLGDSMVFGQGVEAAETFAAGIQSQLSKDFGAPVAVGNAGVPGAGVRQQIRALARHQRSFQPAAVVQCVYMGNDFVDNFDGPLAVVDGAVCGAGVRAACERSLRLRLAMRFRVALAIERWLFVHAPALAMDPRALEAGVDENEARRRIGGPVEEGIFMDAKTESDATRAIAARMVESLEALRAEAAPAPFLVVLIPSYVGAVPGIYESVARRLGYDPALHGEGLAHARLAATLGERGIRCVDLLAFLRAKQAGAPGELLYIPNDGHLSVAGHRAVAEALAPYARQALETAAR